MDFRIKVPVKEGDPKIDHQGGVFLIGSCFVEHIGAKMEWFKFKTLQNPTGIIFHPSPIRRYFQRIAHNENFQEKDLIEYNDGWQSLEAHSDMRRYEKEECLNNLNLSLESSRQFLKKCSHVIISLGTAWGYHYEGGEDVVANCHKIPQKYFDKRLTGIKRIHQDLEILEQCVREINPGATLIFTISPVRHLRDGVVENQLSKAHLIAGLHNYLENSRIASYFPSYEIMMDELRDYRFYTEDMLHPNEVAVTYIWKLFSYNWISEKSIELNKKIDQIQRSLAHRTREENSLAHKKFLTKLQHKIEEIQKKYPEITFS